MLQNFISWVKALFGRITSKKTRHEMSQSEIHRANYEDVTQTNFTSIFSNAIANKTVSDSTMTISDANGGNSKRSDYIDMCLKITWANIKKYVDTALGKGGVFFVPYVSGDRVYVNAIDQTFCDVLDTDGDGNITSIAIRAEVTTVNELIYTRMMYMELRDRVLTIQQKAVDRYGQEVSINTVERWADIVQEYTIGNVDRVPVAYLRCPKSDRKGDTFYGVPITFGCEHTISQLHECINQIQKEYELKQAFVGVDSSMLDKNGKLPQSGLFIQFVAAAALSGKPFFEVFDPAIRDSSYYNRYHELCLQLEREVGTSRGIITEPATAAATATEIKAANKATFDIVSDMRKAVEDCYDTLAYAIDLYAEHFGMTPAGSSGDYSVTFDWDMSMLESTEETFSQLVELFSLGLIRGARLVSYSTGMSMDEAQAEIDAANEEAEKKDAPITSEDLEP